MKTNIYLKGLSILALATAGIASQDALTLRRELKAGTTETYKIESEMKQVVEIPSMGEQDMIMSSIATVSVKTTAVNAEKGTADVEATTKIEKSTTDGSLAAMMGNTETKLPDPKTEKGTLDTRNRIVIARNPNAKPDTGRDPSGGMGAMMGMAAGPQAMLNLIELPEKPIKVGDEISIGPPAGASLAGTGMKELKLTMKFVGEKEHEGAKVWAVTYNGSFKLDMDPSKNPQSQQSSSPVGNVKVTGTGTIKGDGIIDKASGKTLSNVMNMTNNLTVFLESMNMEMPVKGTVVSKLTLVK